MASPLDRRSSGVLLHPTSLPGPFPHGDIGPAAREFIDFLQAAGQRWWQMLPIHPPGGCDSPYDSPSAFAGSPGLISLEDLVGLQLLTKQELAIVPPLRDPEVADFATSKQIKDILLEKAYERFVMQPDGLLRSHYEEFLNQNNPWVWDYALFMALRERDPNKSWVSWDEGLRRRHRDALDRAHVEYQRRVKYFVFCQFLFHHQWDALRDYAAARGVLLMGDVPMFVSHDSADVWANQAMFFLDERGERTVQAGVPPDYFTEDGQLWGNPLYRWDVMQNDGFGWWLDRLRRELKKFDAIRIDHFIALRRYWEVPVPAESAKVGRYVEVPGYEFFRAAAQAFGGLPFVAEDLGIVTESVEQLRDHFELPGMKVVQFAFFEGAEGYLPHRYDERAVVYLGTHDNDTTRGWYEGLVKATQQNGPDAVAAQQQLSRLSAYLGVQNSNEANRLLKRMLLASKANTAILSVQDLLDQSSVHRMNVPGTADGNWTYRMKKDVLTPALAQELRAITDVTERLCQ